MLIARPWWGAIVSLGLTLIAPAAAAKVLFDPSAYTQLLAKAQSGDPAADYTALRMLTLYKFNYMIPR